MVMYLDGVQVDTETVGSLSNDGINIASLGPTYTSGYFFNGKIDEMRVSDVVRYAGNFTPDESFVVDGNTVSYWKFDEGTGSVLVDETASHNGALEGSPEPSWVAGV